MAAGAGVVGLATVMVRKLRRTQVHQPLVQESQDEEDGLLSCQ